MSIDTTSNPNPEIVPIAAVRMDKAPNRQQRNDFFTELGTLQMPDGPVRMYANRKDGSLIAVMKDGQTYCVDTAIFGTQAYKYWKLHPGQSTLTTDEVNELETTPEALPVPLLGLDGNPLSTN